MRCHYPRHTPSSRTHKVVILRNQHGTHQPFKWLPLVQAVERWGTGMSYGALLHNMTETLNQVQPGGNFGLDNLGGTLGSLMNSAMDLVGMGGQRPVMAANWPFDLNRPLAI